MLFFTHKSATVVVCCSILSATTGTLMMTHLRATQPQCRPNFISLFRCVAAAANGQNLAEYPPAPARQSGHLAISVYLSRKARNWRAFSHPDKI